MKTNKYIEDIMISLISIYEPILQSTRRIKLNGTILQLYITVLHITISAKIPPVNA